MTAALCLVSLLAPSSAGAFPWGDNAGVRGYNTDNSGAWLTNRDGFYMNSYLYSSFTYVPGGGCLNANVQPNQIVDINPPQSGKEFIGLGYFVGHDYYCQVWSSARNYIDYTTCDVAGNNCVYNEIVLNPATYSQYNVYQVQRVPDGMGGHHFNAYVGTGYGNQALSLIESVSNHMISGYAPLGGENSNGSTPEDMTRYLTDYYTHGYGGATTQPPGITNYSVGQMGVYRTTNNNCTIGLAAYPNTTSSAGSC